MTAAEVLAPLVCVKNRVGEIGYHYCGSVIPWLSGEDLARLETIGMVRAVDAPAPAADVDLGAEAPVPVPRPAKAHAKDLWVDYAVSKGWDRKVADATNKTDLVAALTADDDDDAPEAPTTDVVPVDEPDTDEAPRPAKAGLLEDWQAYARSKGVPDAEIEGKEKQELIELLT